MAEYRIDILEPDDDLNIAVDNLGNEIGKIYYEAWQQDKEKNYGKPFNLNVNAFTLLWFNKSLRIFVAYNEKDEPVGFLIGMVFRPLPYEANVFQIEDWYTRGDEALKKQLFDFVVNAIRFIGCDEIWVADHDGKAPDLGMRWKEKNTFHLRRYVKD